MAGATGHKVLGKCTRQHVLIAAKKRKFRSSRHLDAQCSVETATPKSAQLDINSFKIPLFEWDFDFHCLSGRRKRTGTNSEPRTKLRSKVFSRHK
ncbi:MAG: hypothetical protein A3H69_05110 [Candidatus Sungbacteria bacterium RIFCSPLOWO2_02_FULL_47_9]|nr:MAG: hypothetical protein A3H69_05110 [Candidatus Sungbacteria bacterium RIFCSPLOWO2_02_FULL_47_9]